jgi:hypothetical protein
MRVRGDHRNAQGARQLCTTAAQAPGRAAAFCRPAGDFTDGLPHAGGGVEDYSIDVIH